MRQSRGSDFGFLRRHLRQVIREHCGRGARAKDQALKEGVGSKAIGAVYAGAGGFSRCVKAGDIGAAVQFGADAAHEVVGRGAHGDEIALEIEAVIGEKRADSRKAVVEIDSADVAHVEINRARPVRAGIDAFTSDGAGDDIARGQFEAGMVALHEALAAVVAQPCALSAKGLREQEAGNGGKEERRGVELVELHVGQLGAGSGGKGDSVTRGDGGIGGVGVDLACSAGRNQNGTGAHAGELLIAVAEVDTGHTAVLNDQSGYGGPSGDADLFMGEDEFGEGAADLRAGGVAVGVQDAWMGVGGFAGTQQDSIFAIKARSPLDKFCNAGRPLGYEDLGSRAEDEAIPGSDGVFEVQRDILLAFGGDSDAALCVVGVGFTERFLGDDKNFSVRS